MTPDEKAMLEGLIQRLRQAPSQAKDAEAEAMIRQAVAAQPDSPYLLAQTVLIQELALNEAQTRIEQLERTAAAPAAAEGGSFLGGLVGRRGGSVPAAGPWRGRPPQTGAGGAGRPQASGFLRNAAATAAGVAGGALLFQGLQSMFGRDAHAAAPAETHADQAADEEPAADEDPGLDDGFGDEPI